MSVVCDWHIDEVDDDYNWDDEDEDDDVRMKATIARMITILMTKIMMG